MNKLLICDLPRCLFGQLYLIVDYLFMSNPRAMFEFLLIVYFKPTRNVQAYASLRWDISFISKHFSAHCLLNEWPLQSNRAFRSKPKSRSWWCVKKGSFDTLLTYSATLTSESKRDLRYDVFDLPYDVYFLSATSSTPSKRPPVWWLPPLAAPHLQ